MPHAGLMNEREMPLEEGFLLRARLHIRGGKRRLREGKISAGIVTLSDAISAALEWYTADPERAGRLCINNEDNLNDDRNAHTVLVRSGVLDATFDYDAFERLLERALDGEIEQFNYLELLREVDSFMTQLGVMPFEEGRLPPEDPSTY